MAAPGYVSADNHLNTQWLPADTWQTRLPSRLRERGPRVVETDDGSFWCWEGHTHRRAAAGSSWQRLADREFAGVPLDRGALPPAQPRLALEHLAMAGVEAAVFFGDTRKWVVESAELRLAMFRAYNDFALELSAAAPGRLVYLPNLPSWDPRASLAELHRLADHGIAAFELGAYDAGARLSEPIWDPLWEEAAARGIVVCSHVGGPAGTGASSSRREPKAVHFSTTPFSAAAPVAEMILGGVFERHPTLMWVVAESRLGWLPFLFSWMDRQLEIREGNPRVSLSLRPSEYARRNLRFTFEADLVGARLLPLDWSGLAATAMWGCDYPHRQGTWPDPEPTIAAMLGDIDADLRDEILRRRAARLFRLALAAAPGAEAR